MQILDCFCGDETGLRFTDLCDRLRLHKSTVYRLLEALRAHNLLELEPTTGKYRLGMKVLELGALAAARLEFTRYAGPILKELVEGAGETAHLCVLDGSDVLYVAKVECRQALRIPSAVGHRNPAYCTGVGKAILAFLPEDELESYLARTELRAFTNNTIVDPTRFRKHLEQIRALGHSFDDGEIDPGVRCIGAPIRDHSGRVVAGISIAGPSLRITKLRIPQLASLVMNAARTLSEKLGCRPGREAGGRAG